MKLLLVVITILFGLLVQNAEAVLNSQQAQALNDLLSLFPELKNSTSGVYNYNWNGPAEQACENFWEGVRCDATNENILRLEVYPGGRSGNDPSTGYIPDSIGDIVSLEQLELYINLTQMPPSTLQKLQNLTILHIQSGRNGTSMLGTPDFPNWLPNLKALTQLSLANFNFSKASLDPLGQMTQLTQLYLYNLYLRRSFPSPIRKLVNLTALGAYYNNLTGPVPSWISELNQLQQISFLSEELTSLPASMGDITTLTDLTFIYGEFRGPFPPTTKLVNLKTIQAAYNHFSGPFPDVRNCKDLYILYVNDNDFTGNVTASIEGIEDQLVSGCAVSYNDKSLVCQQTQRGCCASYVSGHPVCTGCQCPCYSTAYVLSSDYFPSCYEGNWTFFSSINNTNNYGEFRVSQADVITINGDFANNDNATFCVGNQFLKAGKVDVAGNVIIQGGVLTLHITEPIQGGGMTVEIMKGASVTGSFTSVEVTQLFAGSECYTATAEAKFSATSVSAQIKQTKIKGCTPQTGSGSSSSTSVSINILVAMVLAALFLQ